MLGPILAHQLAGEHGGVLAFLYGTSWDPSKLHLRRNQKHEVFATAFCSSAANAIAARPRKRARATRGGKTKYSGKHFIFRGHIISLEMRPEDDVDFLSRAWMLVSFLQVSGQLMAVVGKSSSIYSVVVCMNLSAHTIRYTQYGP